MLTIFRSSILLALSAVTEASVHVTFPSLPRPYSSNFIKPQAPVINVEFRANFMQHKYDVNVNNIVSGYIYYSASEQMVRADAAGDGILESSLFNFKNKTAEGAVLNSILSFEGGVTTSKCSFYFVAPFIPLISPDFLNSTGAVFIGVQEDELHGPVAAWMTKFTDTTVTTYFDQEETFVRYDFAAPSALRTFATTRFFNIVSGPVNTTVFDTPCH